MTDIVTFPDRATGFVSQRLIEARYLLQISKVLNQPVSFFLRASASIEEVRETRFFRSIGTRSNKVNQALDVKTKWLWELVGLIGQHVKLPSANLPEVPAA